MPSCVRQGGAAVANLYSPARLWLWVGRGLAELSVVAPLPLTHAFSQHASMAETYTLWTGPFAGEPIVPLQDGRTGPMGYVYAPSPLKGIIQQYDFPIAERTHSRIGTVVGADPPFRYRTHGIIGEMCQCERQIVDMDVVAPPTAASRAIEPLQSCASIRKVLRRIRRKLSERIGEVVQAVTGAPGPPLDERNASAGPSNESSDAVCAPAAARAWGCAPLMH